MLDGKKFVSATECHLQYGITQCHHINPSQIGRHSTYLPQRDERLSWPRWLVT